MFPCLNTKNNTPCSGGISNTCVLSACSRKSEKRNLKCLIVGTKKILIAMSAGRFAALIVGKILVQNNF
jgi:hypothetical protein